MLDPKDADLVARAQEGSVAAVGELYDRHHESIFRYVRVRVRDQKLAQDLTGEVFLRMLSGLPSYSQGETPFLAWLYRIARNLIIDHSRKQRGRLNLPIEYAENIAGLEGNPVPMVEQKLTFEQVQYAMDTLDAAQREVVMMRFLLGMSLGESAHIMGKSVAAVKSLQHRGLKALRLALQQR